MHGMPGDAADVGKPVSLGTGGNEALRVADADMEMEIIKAEVWRSHIAGCIIAGSLLFSLLFPVFAHLRTVISCSVLVTAICTAVLKLHLTRVDREAFIRRAARAGDVNLFIRTVVHVMVILTHNEEVYLRLITLFVFPLASARGCHRPKSFLCFAAAHMILVIYRFHDDWNANAAYIAATLFTMPMLVDVSVQRQRAKESQVNLAESYKTIRGLAESTARSLMRGFCDAVVTLGPDFRLVEPSKTLGALLNSHVDKGKYFPDLLDMGDRDDFRLRMEEITKTVVKAGPDGALLGPGQPNSLSLRVHLIDSFSNPTPVHIFHSCFLRWDYEPVYLLGVSEAWKPSGTKSSKEKLKPISSLNMETGKVELMAPTFPEGGKGPRVEKSPLSLAIERGEKKNDLKIEKMPEKPTKATSMGPLETLRHRVSVSPPTEKRDTAEGAKLQSTSSRISPEFIDRVTREM